jgi:hypothetical protein
MSLLKNLKTVVNTFANFLISRLSEAPAADIVCFKIRVHLGEEKLFNCCGGARPNPKQKDTLNAVFCDHHKLLHKIGDIETCLV